MPANPHVPEVPVFQKKPPPGTPLPAPDLSDMDRIHHLIKSDHLADIFTRLAGGKRK
jgi:hypothetical protein